MIWRWLLVPLALALPAQAQQYQWTDDRGVVRFSDTPPPAGAKNVRKLSAAPAKPAPAPVPYELARVQKDFPVTLYTSPSCKEGCELARAALNKRGIPFKEVQVWNPETNEELKSVSGALEVPTLLVGRSVQRGYQPEAFDSLLDSAGYPKAGVLPPGKQASPGAPEGYVPPGERDVAKPVEADASAAAQAKPGPYDPSGLKGAPPKPGIYDPSSLQGPPPKPGIYGTPAESK
ncbi:MAG: glutaredoxin family protein [Pseudomonadota bacterium]